MARIHGTKEIWLDALRADGPAFLAAAEDASHVSEDTPIPSCPGWSMTDLVRHLGNVYRWVGEHSVRGVTDKPDRSYSDLAASPAGPDLLAWWNAQFAAILATLEALDPQAPAWNWAPQARTAGFWHRRMANETAVHRWDAQMALGQAEPLEARLAADGVAEVLDTWLPAGRQIHTQMSTDCLIALQALDVEHTWFVRLRGEGIALLDTDTIFDDDDKPARVVAIGSASNLMLALWGRVAWDTLDVSGDEGLLNALRVGR
jgi:uncharacterized protein (TIGR03083 family)